MSAYDDFITHILNIDYDRLEKIDSADDGQGGLLIKVTLKNSETLCPVCKGKTKIHGYNEKKITHSVLNNRCCRILYRQRRYRCRDCELTFSEKNPFSSRNEKLSHETKLNILQDLRRPDNTYTYVGIKNNVSPTEIQKVFDRHVNIERHPLPAALSIDEHYTPESDYDSLYMCIFMDFETGEIVDILPDRKKDYLTSYLMDIRNATFDEKSHTSELNKVKYVSIDLNDIYRLVFSIYCPKALICADPFHVIKNLTKFFNDVRLRCRRNCDDETLIYLLTKFDFVFDHHQNLDNEGKYNRRLGRYINYRGIRDYLFEAFEDLKKAYELKERYIDFNSSVTLSDAPERLEEMTSLFEGCDLKELKPFHTLLVNWKKEIINSFNTVNGKRINNSYIESRNAIIEKLLYNANGMVNFRRTRNRIMYCINKSDTYRF
ncbi:MAG: ISL3 family transposase [Oscillospiraceae bacterium]|nr:ISL3 family transposase [Oscillospiraceae bacterium]